MTRMVNGMPVLNPSRLGGNVWVGTPSDQAGLTSEQIATAAQHEPGRKLPMHEVRLTRPDHRATNGYVEITVCCPVVAETSTGRKIITPSGQMLWLDKKGTKNA